MDKVIKEKKSVTNTVKSLIIIALNLWWLVTAVRYAFKVDSWIAFVCYLTFIIFLGCLMATACKEVKKF